MPVSRSDSATWPATTLAFVSWRKTSPDSCHRGAIPTDCPIAFQPQNPALACRVGRRVNQHLQTEINNQTNGRRRIAADESIETGRVLNSVVSSRRKIGYRIQIQCRPRSDSGKNCGRWDLRTRHNRQLVATQAARLLTALVGQSRALNRAPVPPNSQVPETTAHKYHPPEINRDHQNRLPAVRSQRSIGKRNCLERESGRRSSD